MNLCPDVIPTGFIRPKKRFGSAAKANFLEGTGESSILWNETPLVAAFRCARGLQVTCATASRFRAQVMAPAFRPISPQNEHASHLDV